MSTTTLPLLLAINVPLPELETSLLPRSDAESFGLAFLIAIAAATFVIWLRCFVPDEERRPADGRSVVVEKRTRRSAR
ncbi:MAG: hypothetical protein QM784_29770 [Polyangiaceae bacterium]